MSGYINQTYTGSTVLGDLLKVSFSVESDAPIRGCDIEAVWVLAAAADKNLEIVATPSTEREESP